MKYVIIDKVNEFGYAPSKYADMFNMTRLEYAKPYSEEDKEWCEKRAASLNSIHGYHLEVVEYVEMLLYVIKLNATQIKEEHFNNVTDNKMWSIIHSVDKLEEALKQIGE